MNLIFKDPETLQRMREGPLGPYVDSYAADMHQQGYASPTAEAQIRLVADFSRWLGKRQIAPWKVTTEHCQRYLRFRARHRRPKSDRALCVDSLVIGVLPIHERRYHFGGQVSLSAHSSIYPESPLRH